MAPAPTTMDTSAGPIPPYQADTTTARNIVLYGYCGPMRGSSSLRSRIAMTAASIATAYRAVSRLTLIMAGLHKPIDRQTPFLIGSVSIVTRRAFRKPSGHDHPQRTPLNPHIHRG